MEAFVRRFIRSSVCWLGIGVLVGVSMALWPTAVLAYRPAHAHANLLGFVSMMIFGVAYHVLPRLSGAPLHSRRLAALPDHGSRSAGWGGSGRARRKRSSGSSRKRHGRADGACSARPTGQRERMAGREVGESDPVTPECIHRRGGTSWPSLSRDPDHSVHGSSSVN